MMSQLRLPFCLVALIAIGGIAVAFAKEATISQKGKAFSVDTITIKPGDEVVFKNDDDVAHNVYTSSKGMEFNLKVQNAGTQAGQVFKNEGVAEVKCAFHPRMKVTVVVKK
jgi:plastocyanin